jgi:cell division protein FtsB
LLLLRRHQSELAEKRDHLIRENTELRKRIERLRSDDGYIERMIREELGYVRGDEIVYRFHDDRRADDR